MSDQDNSKPVKAGAIQASGKFQPGQSGNLKGRPKGARNRAGLMAEAMLADHTDAIMKTWLLLAETDPQTNREAIRLLIPRSRASPMALALPDMKDMAGISLAYDAVARALREGQLNAEEVNAALGLITGKRSLLGH